MGFYINPKNETKEEFLAKKGIAVPNTFKWENRLPNTLPVVLVDNGPFTAAGIAYSKEEYLQFNNHDPSDERAKIVFLVDIDDLIPVSNLTRNAIKE